MKRKKAQKFEFFDKNFWKILKIFDSKATSDICGPWYMALKASKRPRMFLTARTFGQAQKRLWPVSRFLPFFPRKIFRVQNHGFFHAFLIGQINLFWVKICKGGLWSFWTCFERKRVNPCKEMGQFIDHLESGSKSLKNEAKNEAKLRVEKRVKFYRLRIIF